jgi:hypothetical protein
MLLSDFMRLLDARKGAFNFSKKQAVFSLIFAPKLVHRPWTIVDGFLLS